jgi:3-oxoacyl-[acyl-carrier protein] reductase
MELKLSGKRAWVLGGTAGIGLAVAEELLQEGAAVVVSSRDRKNVAATVEQLVPQWGEDRVSGVVVDTESEDSLREAFLVASKAGPIQILLNNTGGPATGAPLSVSLEDWDRGYRTLLRSVITTAQLAVPAMRERGWGRILTVTSTSARETIPGLPVSAVFRTALTAWAKELAKEVGQYGILVNNLLPGPTATARMAALAQAHGAAAAASVERLQKETALRRAASPDEIARVAAFLLSDANGYVTGTDVLVDGGATRSFR